MRIRKNAKLSHLLFSSTTTTTTTTTTSQGGGSVPVSIATHVCQLNQSPWDVIPFDYDSIQFDGDDSGGNNGSSPCDSFGAVESNSATASMMETELTEEKLKIQHMVLDDNRNKKAVAAVTTVSNRGRKNACLCQGIDEKGLPCKNRVKNGHTPALCGYHLSLLRSYNNAVKKAPQSSRRGVGKPRGATVKKPAAAPSSSNPYEFYYYSGFGPLWGKRRGGDRNGEASKNSVGEDSNSTMVGMEMEMESEEVIEGSDAVVVVADDNDNSNSNENNDNVLAVASGKDYGVFDFVDDIDDDEDGDDNGGKKRMRKPVKERSLKSLM